MPGTLTGAELTWSYAHLLDIHYTTADINQITNLWASSELRKPGGEVGNNYLIEIRLAPTSSDYSLLNPDGTFKSTE